MPSVLSIILHGNTDSSVEGFSATACFQNHLEKQTGGFLGVSTWVVRQLFTPLMAAVELPVRIVQLALMTFINFITGSFLRSEDKSSNPTWHNVLATKIRNENFHLLAASFSAFVSIFTPSLGSICGSSSREKEGDTRSSSMLPNSSESVYWGQHYRTALL